MSIYSYQKVTDRHTTYSLAAPTAADGSPMATELATINGMTYVHVPDRTELPRQPSQIQIEPVQMTDDLRRAIMERSPHVQLINRRVVGMIRERYSVNDELKMLRIAPSEESAAYNDYVESCRAWGREQKQAMGL